MNPPLLLDSIYMPYLFISYIYAMRAQFCCFFYCRTSSSLIFFCCCFYFHWKFMPSLAMFGSRNDFDLYQFVSYNLLMRAVTRDLLRLNFTASSFMPHTPTFHRPPASNIWHDIVCAENVLMYRKVMVKCVCWHAGVTNFLWFIYSGKVEITIVGRRGWN